MRIIAPINTGLQPTSGLAAGANAPVQPRLTLLPADVNDDWKRLEQENMRAEMFTLRRVQKI
jgi:hypothetical protein